ncbi:hypothetical protein [Winogradskyella sp. UBA3174]|uniref:hypothetical protein n=1 Tax=Winogradskyella sp. UBA3174 TaxID=1947785 RepID=UPI0025E38348|nr:hypothetical protein [Winogradskyella sp. UBA3174]
MKKYVLLAILCIAMFTSCSLDDDSTANFSLEVLPIESVEMPEQFIHGETYEIFITYVAPSSCYEFNDFIYEIDGHERTVAIINTVYNNADCIEETELVTVSLDFTVTGTETYVFKFYQGEDDQGVDQYYLVEVPVVLSRTVGSTRQ